MAMKASESRSWIYSIFDTYIAFPTIDSWGASLAQNKLVLFEDTIGDLPYHCHFDALTIDENLTLDDLNRAFTANFDTGTASISLHGRSYSNTGDQKLFEELFRFYEHFGLDFSSSNNDFWPDALEVELEFMHYLTYLEELAGEDRLGILKAQRDFLVRHIGPLVGGINDLLVEKEIPVYNHLMALLNEFVDAERSYLNEAIGDQISLKQVC